jgi:hypothetical protein
LALLSLPLLGSWRLAMGLCALVRAVVFVAASAITTRSAESGATSVWALYNGGCLILFSFVPAFFVAHGMSLALAGAMTSLCLYTMIPVAPFGGWLFARSVGVIPGILLSLARMAALPVLLLTNIPPAALMIAFGAIVGLRLAAVRSSRSQARVCSPRSGHWRGEACSRYSTLRWPRPHRWPVLRATSP